MDRTIDRTMERTMDKTTERNTDRTRERTLARTMDMNLRQRAKSQPNTRWLFVDIQKVFKLICAQLGLLSYYTRRKVIMDQ